MLTSLAGRPGLVGKAPTQPDFVRIDAGEPLPQQLLRWLEEADDALRRTGASLPATPIQFLFAASEATQALVGVLTPSRDQVGRSFPLALFANGAASELATQLPLVPLTYADFLRAGTALLEAVASLPTADLTSAVRALSTPQETEWRRAASERARRFATSGEAFRHELSVAGGEGGDCYAVQTLLTACQERARQDRVVSKATPKAPVVLACPLGPLGPLPWLELAARSLDWSARPPALLWTHERLLICLGPPPATVLSYLVRPESQAATLWPLVTQSVAAREAAARSLSPERRAAFADGELSLGDLLARLATGQNRS